MQFRILGPLDALADDGAPIDIGGAKRSALLAILLVSANQAVSVDHLIEALWADTPPGKAKGTIQAHVSRLRASLPPETLITRIPGYLVRVGPDDLDATVFERMVGEAHTAAAAGAHGAASERLHSALELWRGSPLAEFTYEDWAQPTINGLGDLRLTALEDRVEADLNLGRHHPLTAELEELVARHPLRERLWSLLMLALYRSGRQADALRAFGTAQTTLGEELGIDPSPELRELEDRILLQDSRLDWRPHRRTDSVTIAAQPTPAEGVPEVVGTLPAPLTSFIGRRAELDSVRHLLKANRLVTLTGPGGVGKTRLALEAARAATSDHPGGSWFVDLSKPLDPAFLALEIATAIGLEARSADAALDEIAKSLRSLRALVLIDNCEPVVDEIAPLVQALLDRCPQLSIMTTSRCPLGIPGERVWVMPTLGLPSREDTVEQGMASDAIDLFLDRALHARPGWQPGRAELSSVAEICRRLDGIPLALELAAALVKTRTVESILDGLDDRFALLDTSRRGVPTRHQTLASVLEDSVDRLDMNTRSLFQCVSVFEGGFTREAVGAVCSKSERLDDLVSAALVTVDYVAGSPRFGMLETIRAFARRELSTGGRQSGLQDRHALYFAEWARNADVQVVTAEAEWLDKMAVEHDNVRSALAWTGEGRDPETAALLAVSYGWFWLVRGFLEEGRRWIEGGLAVVDPSYPRLRDLLNSAGYLSGEQGDLNASTRFLEQTLDIDESAGDPGQLAATLINLSNLAGQRGDQRATRDYAQRGVELVESIPEPSDKDLHRLAAAYLSLAAVHQRLGEHERIEPLAERVIDLSDRMGLQYLRGRAEHILGELALERGDHAEVQAHLEAGLVAAEKSEDPIMVAALESLRAWSAVDRGKFDEAMAAMDQAVAAGRSAGSKESSLFFAIAAFVAEQVGDRAKSGLLLSRAITSSNWPDERRAQIDEIRAWMALERGRVDEAAELAAHVDASCRKTGYVHGRMFRMIADQTRSALAGRDG